MLRAMGMTRVAAVMAAYNRRELTLACLRSLEAQQVPSVELDVFVLDDASSDGTGQAIAEQFPQVNVLRDRGEEAAIVARSTRHPATGELTSGGVVHPFRWRPLRSVLVEPGNEPRPCHTMNGNTTLVPRAVVRRVGNIDPAFVQQMGDFDYGLRARAAGCSVWIAPGTVATCASHPERRPGERPFLAELRELWSIKTLSPRPWAVYARRWAGWLWPLYWASPYLRRGCRLAREHLLARRVAADSS
jgi:GT2 family glycosyltransferase